MTKEASRVETSSDLATRAKKVLAPGAQDYLRVSEHPDFPRLFSNSGGVWLTDPNGRKYLDFYLGSGAVILGHGHRGQVAAVGAALRHGATVSLRHPVEVELAERLVGLIGSINRVMFFKTGSECVHKALSIALRATGRNRIVSLGYHGWLFPFGWDRTANSAIVEEPAWVLNEALGAIREAGSSLAGVIVSPSPYMTDPVFYRALNIAAYEQGGLFIMDEVKSGFRWHFPCVSTAWGLTPDLLLLSKAVANGFPLSVLGGREDLLADRDLISVFSTYASENVSLTAALACIDALADGAHAAFAEASARLRRLLAEALNGTAIAVVGGDTFFRLHLSDAMNRADVAMAMARAGVLFHPKDEVLVSAAHAEPGLIEEGAGRMVKVFKEMEAFTG